MFARTGAACWSPAKPLSDPAGSFPIFLRISEHTPRKVLLQGYLLEDTEQP